MTPRPTSEPLQQELAALTARLRPYLHRPDLTIDRLLRMQHEASTAPTKTVGSPTNNVLQFPTPYEASGAECHDDEPEAA